MLGEPQGDAVVEQGGSTHPVWDLWVPSGAGRLCLRQLLICKAVAWGVGLGPAVRPLEVSGEVSQHEPAGAVVARAGRAGILPSPSASRVPWVWEMLPGGAPGARIQTPAAPPPSQSPLGLPTKVCPEPR